MYIVGFRWVSDQACRFDMSPMGLRSDMSVSDGSPIGLRWDTDNNNIFVNSYINDKWGGETDFPDGYVCTYMANN